MASNGLMFNRMEVDDMDKENVWDTAEDMGMLYEFDQTGEPETGEADEVVSIEDSFVMSMRNKGTSIWITCQLSRGHLRKI